MNRTELASVIAEDIGLNKTQVESALKSFVNIVKTTVAGGEEVKLPDFGTFGAKDKPARTARNPQTGEMIDIPEKRVPQFKAAKAFKDVVAGY